MPFSVIFISLVVRMNIFIRTTKEIKITEKGIQFYNYAQGLIHHYHQTIEKMYDLNTSHAPKIKLSILEL